ncbi:hypothetical protein SCHPADRAFT_911252 [Schizopora paradoxa]|uniref:Uncharacterized protein n=1 Tax=Schizopora paradoxa TaxID=27342 RepID=A0A0H2R1A5_9AGAM|nr:hypothetical protein SCHPADRAFT_911252 [Schizopora paradoxa]
MKAFSIGPFAVAIVLMTSFAYASPLVLERAALDVRAAEGKPFRSTAHRTFKKNLDRSPTFEPGSRVFRKTP